MPIDFAPNDGDLVPTDNMLLRLPKPPPDFTPSGWKPTWQQFSPSSDDKHHVENRAKPVRVSVWDEARTSVEQAVAFRSVPDVVVLRLPGNAPSGLAKQYDRPIQVVYEPLDPPDSELPGADGHAGIEGLDRESGTPKNKWRSLLDDLASFATVVGGFQPQLVTP